MFHSSTISTETANIVCSIKTGSFSKNEMAPPKKTFRNKSLVLCAFLFCSAIGLFSQDIITKKDGTEIQAKVTEVGVNEVKYTRFGTTSPTYTMLKSEIFMIKYEDGTKDMFNTETVQQQTPAQAQTGWYDNQQGMNADRPIYKYTFGTPISPVGNMKSAWGSGIASFFIPGLGQFINGDVGGGFLFLGGNIICNSMWMNAEDESVFLIGLVDRKSVV